VKAESWTAESFWILGFEEEAHDELGHPSNGQSLRSPVKNSFVVNRRPQRGVEGRSFALCLPPYFI
jgi:hypothetical protein